MTDRRALLLLAALAILTAFYPVLFGELPVPAAGARMILPDDRPPEDRNDELGDVPTQFLPWTAAVADGYRAGRLPLRFAANGCGTPLWANPQAQAVTPTTLFSVLLAPPGASARPPPPSSGSPPRARTSSPAGGLSRAPPRPGRRSPSASPSR